MQSLVQIAFNTIQSFGLSASDKETLIGLLQGDEKQVIEKQARKKLKVLTEEEIEEQQIRDWLIKNHFKSQNGKSLIK